MSQDPQASPSPRAMPHRRGWLDFLGSMNLAIALLVVIAIASVIGTVLQQNQPYNGYREQYGPFWFEIFRSLGLYDVYGSVWFLLILGFLVLSTSVCIWRNAPHMLRDMQSWRLGVKRKSLKLFHHHAEWQSEHTAAELAPAAASVLEKAGYRTRTKDAGDHVVVSGVRGAWNRAGYLFTHVSIVIICLGGLIDGNIGLHLRELTGSLVVQTRDMLLSEVPPESRLKPGTILSFRGNRSVPEGTVTNVVTLQIRNGYVIQELPFAIRVRDFRVRYYSTGQPKSFETDLEIIDDRLDKPLRRTIRVNHPLTYRGYTIYQASFGDGGSELKLTAWPLAGTKPGPDEALSARKWVVSNKYPIDTPRGRFTLEITEFRANNIFPVKDRKRPGGKRFEQWGPSVTYRLRNTRGEANEYVNYMVPRRIKGRLYYVSGVRKSLDQDFRFWNIPADPKGTPGRFMRLRAMVHDNKRMDAIVRRYTEQVYGSEARIGRQKFFQRFRLNRAILARYLDGSLNQVFARMQRDLAKQPKRFDQVRKFYLSTLIELLKEAYLQVLAGEGVDISKGVTDPVDRQFFVDAYEALSVLPRYDAPYYFQLSDFRLVEASGLQIARAPGKTLVYLGSLLLIIGVFVMFYVHYRRMWIHLQPRDDGTTEVIVAGTGTRNSIDFDREFARLVEQARDRL